MSGELVRRNYGGQLQRATTNAMNEVAARQAVIEKIIKAKSEVAEFAVGEVAYLHAIAHLTELKNPLTAEAVSTIVGMAVASIIRTNGEFGGHL